ncbi:PRDM9 methyltransferase, partial [Steatornis caripensis]|nr:PRDM9 methyltransferase [Steatornis caripensis]
CHNCSTGFNHCSNLLVHQWSHLEQKPYICLVCPKSFTCSSQLIQHRQSHSEEKP